MLTRKVGQSIVIQTPSGTVEVHVRELSAGRASIGVKAPKEFTIWRGEMDRSSKWESLGQGWQHQLIPKKIQQ